MARRTPKTPVDIESVSGLLRQVAAEIIVPRHRKLGQGDITEKDHGELVTIADTETEQWLGAALTDLLPGSCVVGEEAAFVDRRLFDLLSDEKPVWVIDPVDGTHNFAHGSDIFAVIVALVVGGETVAGWIYEPIGETLARGERGAGVWINTDRVELGAPQTDPRCNGVAATQLFDRADRDQSFIDNVYRPNCAGHEYIQLLRGERCFTAYTRLMPWDHAAGKFHDPRSRWSQRLT